ncbi:hypothetical protein CSKR_108153 [Clonorchis sinensis]|uniref:Uncharacterized protein n=1 Tax=Clonorchis sinensis TaxID=79923 RepID=A0A419PYL0_CLOSI|nr:hypothetical protein CSKR_108153 [Clonorchis sinensis]
MTPRFATGYMDSRIDTQDRGFRPSFPGRFCFCRSAAVVHLKGTKGAWTTVSGRLFHAATTQNEKKVSLMKVCALTLKIFLPCTRRVFARSTVKNLLLITKIGLSPSSYGDGRNSVPTAKSENPYECSFVLEKLDAKLTVISKTLEEANMKNLDKNR